MKTLKEVMNDSGVSYARIAKKSDISPQAVCQYKDSPAKMGKNSSCSWIEIFKDVGDELFYSKSGRFAPSVKYKLVRTFFL